MGYFKKRRFWIPAVLACLVILCSASRDFIATSILSEHLFEYTGPEGDYNLDDERIAKIITAINEARKIIEKKDGGKHFGRYQKRMMEHLTGKRPFNIYWSKHVDDDNKRPFVANLFIIGECGYAFFLSEKIIFGPGTFFSKCFNPPKSVIHEILHLAIGTPSHKELLVLVKFYF